MMYDFVICENWKGETSVPGFRTMTVSHWMPLPVPPKEG